MQSLNSQKVNQSVDVASLRDHELRELILQMDSGADLQLLRNCHRSDLLAIVQSLK